MFFLSFVQEESDLKSNRAELYFDNFYSNKLHTLKFLLNEYTRLNIWVIFPPYMEVFTHTLLMFSGSLLIYLANRSHSRVCMIYQPTRSKYLLAFCMAPKVFWEMNTAPVPGPQIFSSSISDGPLKDSDLPAEVHVAARLQIQVMSSIPGIHGCRF